MHPDIYKRPLLWILFGWIAAILLFFPQTKGISSSFLPRRVELTGRVESFVLSNAKTNNVIIKLLTLDGRPTQGRVYARFADFEPQWKDVISFEGKLTPPYGVDLIGNFNWRTYLARKNIFAEVSATQGELVRPAAWPLRVLRQVRRNILTVFEDHFPRELSAIAQGILLGEHRELNPALYTAFQNSGTIHLLVASGGNVGFVTLLVFLGCGFFSLSRKKAMLLALLVAGIYTLLAGADAPLVRAYFMTACAALGYLLHRNSGVVQGLLLSAFIILLARPTALFDTGFQMSFLATLAIILGATNFPIPSSWPRLLRFFGPIFMATLCSQLMLLPIFTNVFYKVSLAGLAANMVLVPMASGLLGLGAAYYLAELLRVGFILYFPLLWGLKLFRFFVQFFASFSFSALTVTAWQPTTVAAYFIGLFLLFNLSVKTVFRKCVFPCIILICGLLFYSYQNNRHTHIYLLNEWGKNTVLVKTPSRQVFVFGSEISGDKIRQALFRVGAGRVTGEFAFSAKQAKLPLQDFVPVEKRVIPFTDAWPTESWTFDQTRIELLWGIFCRKDASCRIQKGYTGTKHDGTSYCVSLEQESFCIGANGSFIMHGDKRIFAKQNKTVSLKI